GLPRPGRRPLRLVLVAPAPAPRACLSLPTRRSSDLSQCTQNQKVERLITRHIYQDAVDNANAVRVSRQGRKLYQRRAETVERSRSEEHTSELQSRFDTVCRLLRGK